MLFNVQSTTFKSRADRFLTLNVFKKLAVIYENKARQNRIPILMYHSISNNSDNEKHPFYQTYTTLNTFRKHMSILRNNGYTVIPLQTAIETLQIKKVEAKSVVITFDDGFKDFKTVAWPILKKYGFPVTMFIATGFSNSSGNSFLGKKCLSWEQINKLAKEDVEIGSHSMTHTRMDKLEEGKLYDEIVKSKKIIENTIGRQVCSFSSPYAFPDNVKFIKKYESILKDAGYRIGVTTRIGRAGPEDCPYLLKRIPINEYDDQDFFIAKLEGAYDWIYAVQSLKKKIVS